MRYILINDLFKLMQTEKLSNSSGIIRLLLVIFLASFLICISISRFDQYNYSQTTAIKVDALELMDLAVNDYNSFETKDQEFQTKLEKIYEYEKNKPKNDLTIQLWNKLIDTKGHLLGGLLNRWKTEKKLNGTFLQKKRS